MSVTSNDGDKTRAFCTKKKIQARVLVITSNQHSGVVIFLHLNIQVWGPTNTTGWVG